MFNIIGPRSASSFLYPVLLFLSIASSLLCLYLSVCFLFGIYEVGQTRFLVRIPFLSESIRGNNASKDMWTICLLQAYAGLFLYQLSRIFKRLGTQHPFHADTTRHVRHFTLLNLVIGPGLYVVIHFGIMQKEHFYDIHNLIIQIIFGLIALFLIPLFKKAQALQEEQQLTI